jgi:hypothetical protein
VSGVGRAVDNPRIHVEHLKRSLFFILWLSLSALAWAQEPKISAHTDSVEYKVGSWILLYVDADLPPSVDSLVVAFKDSLGSFEVLSVDQSSLKAGRQQWVFRLTVFDTGKVYIPPAVFAYTARGDTAVRIAYANPIPLTIVGIPVDFKGDIKDIKPPLNAPWKFEDFLPYLIALVAVALLGLGYWYYRRLKKRRESSYVPPKPEIPPWRVALAALHTVEDQRLWQQGRVKQFYSETTEIIRRFLEDQYGLFALESTSDEIVEQLKQTNEAKPLLKDFGSFLTTADLVKFAKYLPTPEENEQELTWAYHFVRTMTPHPASPTPGNAAAASPTVTIEEKGATNVR